MIKAASTVALLSLLSLPAHAQSVEIISVSDDIGPSNECPLKFRQVNEQQNCYVMPPDDPRLTPINWGQAHNNPRFHLTITGPALVEAIYDQVVFANTPFTLAKYGPPTSAGFRIAIGINSTVTPCAGVGAVNPSYAADNAQAQNSAHETAKCNLVLAAGETVELDPMTAQRDGIGYFNGPGESTLTATVFRPAK